MKRIRKLGAVTFDLNAMYILEEFEPNTFISEIVKSAADTDIVYYAVDNSPTITLDSQGYSLVDDAGREAIIVMYNSPETVYILEDTDGGTQEVYFKLDEPPKFTEYGLGSCLYAATITLTKKG